MTQELVDLFWVAVAHIFMLCRCLMHISILSIHRNARAGHIVQKDAMLTCFTCTSMSYQCIRVNSEASLVPHVKLLWLHTDAKQKQK